MLGLSPYEVVTVLYFFPALHTLKCTVQFLILSGCFAVCRKASANFICYSTHALKILVFDVLSKQRHAKDKLRSAFTTSNFYFLEYSLSWLSKLYAYFVSSSFAHVQIFHKWRFVFTLCVATVVTLGLKVMQNVNNPFFQHEKYTTTCWFLTLNKPKLTYSAMLLCMIIS